MAADHSVRPGTRWTKFRPERHPIDERRVHKSLQRIKSLGFITSKTRTRVQTLIGTFWNGNIQDFLNEIAQTARWDITSV